MIRVFVVLFSILFTACSSYTPTTEKILTYHSTIPLKKVNSTLFEKFPFTKKNSAGSLVYKNAFLTPQDSKKVSVAVSFSLKSYEIPEGTDGLVLLNADVRYNKDQRVVSLTNFKTLKVTISDSMLAKYVSSKSKKVIASDAIKRLSKVSIYKIEKNFTTKFIKSVDVQNGKIVVAYGL